MSNEKATKDPAGQQPEFLRGLEAAAHADGQKPADQSETATPATTPEPSAPEKEQGIAAGILKRNAEKDTGSRS